MSPLKCFSGILYLFASCKAGSCCGLILWDFCLSTQDRATSVPCLPPGHCPRGGQCHFSCPKTLSQPNQSSTQGAGKTFFCHIFYYHSMQLHQMDAGKPCIQCMTCQFMNTFPVENYLLQGQESFPKKAV